MKEREISACLISVQTFAHLVLLLCIVFSLCEDRPDDEEPVIMASSELESMLRRDQKRQTRWAVSCGIAFNIWVKLSHTGFILAMGSQALAPYIKDSRGPMEVEMCMMVANMCTVCLDLCAIIVYYEVAETDRYKSQLAAEHEQSEKDAAQDEQRGSISRISALSKFIQPQDLESAYLLPSGDILLSAGQVEQVAGRNKNLDVKNYLTNIAGNQRNKLQKGMRHSARPQPTIVI